MSHNRWDGGLPSRFGFWSLERSRRGLTISQAPDSSVPEASRKQERILVSQASFMLANLLTDCADMLCPSDGLFISLLMRVSS